MGGIPQVSRCPWLADYLAGFPGVTTDYKAEWGFLHYRVGGRIFAIICTPDARYKEHAGRSLVTLSCDGRMSEGLREQYADIVPGFYADHRFWISVYLDGEVPDDQAALEALPGVGRKTAHVVRGTWFGHELLAVDTHVGRVSRRLGWTEATDPRRVEQDVLDRLRTDGAPAEATVLGLRLILHGRRVCLAGTPRCGTCTLADVCPSAEVDR